MRIRKLTVAGFMSFKEPATIEFPETGVVLLTGENGCGKSSIAESVSVALWGEGIRPTTLWRANSGGSILLSLDGIDVSRIRTKSGKASLVWTESPTFDTVTKAQTALDEILPITRAIWQRTHVFRSFDIGAISRADDASRKRLFEKLLSIDGFDDALAACRKDIADVRNRVNLSVVDAANFVERCIETDKEIANILVAYRNEAVEIENELAEINRAIVDLDQQHAIFTAEIEQHTGAKNQCEIDARLLSNEMLSLQKHLSCNNTICTACKQPIALTESEIARTQARTHAIEQSLQQNKLAHNTAVTHLIAAHTKKDAVIAKKETHVARFNLLRGVQLTNQQRKNRIDQLLQRHDTTYDKLTAAYFTLHTAKQQLPLLQECENVLGLQGVRSRILSDALRAVTEETNHWLDLLTKSSNPITIALNDTKRTTSGKTVDKIDLAVLGAGDGHGYLACSDGEQRRIDLALLFGISALSPIKGTLFIDECFDGLHETGVQDAIEALKEISKERCVVLTTHRSDIEEMLQDAVHYHFYESGKLKRYR